MLQLAKECQAFIVEELPKYEPVGSGAFTWLWLRKENLHTDTCVQILSQLLGCKTRDIGYAGKKDKLSISAQWFSVPGLWQGLPTEGVGAGGQWSIEKNVVHDHSLSLGQLNGNRFTLNLDASAFQDGEVLQLTEACAQMPRRVLLNRYGQQRFGHQAQNLSAATYWAAGDYQACVDLLVSTQKGDAGLLRPLLRAAQRETNPKNILFQSGKTIQQFFASVAQSHVFNLMADARHKAGLVRQVRVGDLLLRQGKSAFHARADERDQLQIDLENGEVATTAALPGFKVRKPSSEIEAEEKSWIADCGIDLRVFSKGGVFASPGERRKIQLQFIEPLVYDQAQQRITFALPAGSYASEVMDALQIIDPRR